MKGWVRDEKNPERSAHLTDASGIADVSRGYDRYALERPAEAWSEPSTYTFSVDGSSLTMNENSGYGISGTFAKK